MFKLDDIKVGMVLELEYLDKTSLAMVLPTKNTDRAVSGEVTWFPLERLNDKLTYSDTIVNKIWDICESNRDAHKLSTDGRRLLWDRSNDFEFGDLVFVKDKGQEKWTGKYADYKFICQNEDGTYSVYSQSFGIETWDECKLIESKN